MTDQEVFTKIKKHLLRQGDKSFIISCGTIMCMYRGPDNKMCAVGCLIPDSKYSKDLEGASVESPKIEMLLGEVLGTYNKRLLSELQSVHDSFAVHEWEIRLKLVAKSFKLEY